MLTSMRGEASNLAVVLDAATRAVLHERPGSLRHTPPR